MNFFRRRLSERCADVLDWIDYRPDANFWPFFAIPPMLSVAWAYSGTIGLGLILGIALCFTLFVASLTVVATLVWIVSNAVLDVLASGRLSLPVPRVAAGGFVPASRSRS